MPESIGDPVAYQIERMARRTEENRQRMYDQMMRQSAASTAEMGRVQMISSQALGMARGAAVSVGRGVAAVPSMMAPGVAMGAGYAGAQASSFAPDALSAFSLQGGPLAYGPQTRGAIGGYYAGAQSFGGLLYEAGLGSALNAATGGLFFRDVNRRFGVAPGIIEEASRDELGLRFESIGNRFLSSLPFARRMGVGFRDLEERNQRRMAQRLSFVRSAGMAGASRTGYGFRSRSGFIEGIAEGQDEAYRSLDTMLGYSGDREDMLAATEAGLAGFGNAELERMARDDPQKITRELRDATITVERLARQTKLDIDAVREFRQALSGYMEEGGVTEFISGVGRDVQAGGLFGGQTAGARRAAAMQRAREAFALGMDPTQFGGFDIMRQRQSTALYESAVRGEVDRSTLYMYGGANDADAAERFNLRMARMGLQANMGSPGMRTLAFQAPGAFRQVLGGQMNQMDILGAQAGATLANPFAATTALYDPATLNRMQNARGLGAFQRARAMVTMQEPVMRAAGATGQDVEAQMMEQFREMAGIAETHEGRMEARRLFQRFSDRQRNLRRLLPNDRDASGAMLLMQEMEELNPAVTPEQAAAAFGEIGDVGERFGGMAARRALARNAARGLGDTGMSRFFATETKRIRIGSRPGHHRNVNIPVYGTRSRRRRIIDGELMDTDDEFLAGREEGVRTNLFQDAIASAISDYNMTPKQINELIREEAGSNWNRYMLDDTGNLMVWSSDNRDRAEWQNVETVSDARDRLGDSGYEQEGAKVLFRVLERINNMNAGGAMATGLRRQAFRRTGASGELFLSNLGGGELGDRVSTLFRTKDTSTLNRFQREFLGTFARGSGADRQVTGAGLVQGFGGRENGGLAQAKEFLRLFYEVSGGDNVEATLSRIETAETGADLTRVMEGLNSQQRRALRSDLALFYMNRNRSALESEARNVRGQTRGSPMFVELVKESSGVGE